MGTGDPRQLVDDAVRAEEVGFDLLVDDGGQVSKSAMWSTTPWRLVAASGNSGAAEVPGLHTMTVPPTRSTAAAPVALS